jgi:hypothetical protein
MNSCVLCKDMPCCPEHCCNWDECDCGDCDACVFKPQVQPQLPKPVLQEPVKIILLANNQHKHPQEEEEKKSLVAVNQESKQNTEDCSSPRPAGSSIFGIRYLKKKK